MIEMVADGWRWVMFCLRNVFVLSDPIPWSRVGLWPRDVTDLGPIPVETKKGGYSQLGTVVNCPKLSSPSLKCG